MNKVFRAASVLALLTGLGLMLRWATAGTLDRLSADDFASLAGLVIATVAWAAYGWLCLAVAVTVLERTPGALGRAAVTVSGAITSDASRTLLRSALGVAVAAPLTVGVAHATPSGTGTGTHSLHWAPVEKASSVPSRSTGWDPRGGIERPSTVRIGEARQSPPRLAVPDRPTTGAATRYTPIRRARPAVVVRRGDSLWSIARAELGPGASDAAVARRWPQWYAANTGRIGPDPDLIQPGQVLQPPTHRHTQPSQEK